MCRWVGAERLAEEAWSEVGHGLCDVSLRGALMVLGHTETKKKTWKLCQVVCLRVFVPQARRWYRQDERLHCRVSHFDVL